MALAEQVHRRRLQPDEIAGHGHFVPKPNRAAAVILHIREMIELRPSG